MALVTQLANRREISPLLLLDTTARAVWVICGLRFSYLRIRCHKAQQLSNTPTQAHIHPKRWWKPQEESAFRDCRDSLVNLANFSEDIMWEAEIWEKRASTMCQKVPLSAHFIHHVTPNQHIPLSTCFTRFPALDHQYFFYSAVWLNFILLMPWLQPSVLQSNLFVKGTVTKGDNT